MSNEGFKFEIVEHIGVLSESANGWATELNRVKWNDREAVFDVRAWSPDHTKCGKGKTFTDEEMDTLISLMGAYSNIEED